jgi:hypothetical protein
LQNLDMFMPRTIFVLKCKNTLPPPFPWLQPVL